MDSGNGWGEWKNHVLIELKKLSADNETQTESIQELNENFIRLESELRFKSGLWGAMSGALGMVIYLAIKHL